MNKKILFAVCLAILAVFVVKGPMKWALFAVTILSILLAWGHNFAWFSRLFVDYFPGYDKFRTVSSILVIAEFTIPLLAVIPGTESNKSGSYKGYYEYARRCRNDTESGGAQK